MSYQLTGFYTRISVEASILTKNYIRWLEASRAILTTVNRETFSVHP